VILRKSNVAVLKKPAHLSQEFCPEILGGSNYEIVGFEGYFSVESSFLLRIFLHIFFRKVALCGLSRGFSGRKLEVS
jgi:hypothetical protein